MHTLLRIALFAAPWTSCSEHCNYEEKAHLMFAGT